MYINESPELPYTRRSSASNNHWENSLMVNHPRGESEQIQNGLHANDYLSIIE